MCHSRFGLGTSLKFLIREANEADYRYLKAWKARPEHEGADTLTFIRESHARGDVRLYLVEQITASDDHHRLNASESREPAGVAGLNERYLQYVFVPRAPIDFRRAWPLADAMLAVLIQHHFATHPSLCLSDPTPKGSALAQRLGWVTPANGSEITRENWLRDAAPRIAEACFDHCPSG